MKAKNITSKNSKQANGEEDSIDDVGLNTPDLNYEEPFKEAEIDMKLEPESSMEPSSSSSASNNNFLKQQVNKNDDGKSKLINFVVQGKKIKLSQADYDKFTRNGKWTSCEFFRSKTTETEKPCEFCKLKCKTIIDTVYMCAQCRHFAHKSLVKHHMFVCKQTDLTLGPCMLKELGVDLSKSIVCRYCHFKTIINRLPSLNRLQHHLVQFINNRIIYVNSVSKKTMLWKNRLADQMLKKSTGKLLQKKNSSLTSSSNSQVNHDEKSGLQINDAPTVSSTVTRKSSVAFSKNEPPVFNHSNISKDILLSKQEQQYDSDDHLENFGESEANQPYERRGPRVKHVSRYSPTVKNYNNFTIYDFSKENKNKYLNHINKLNAQNDSFHLGQNESLMSSEAHSFISWETFVYTEQQEPVFNLSALSQESKRILLNQLNLNRSNEAAAKSDLNLSYKKNLGESIGNTNQNEKNLGENDIENVQQCFKSSASFAALIRSKTRRKQAWSETSTTASTTTANTSDDQQESLPLPKQSVQTKLKVSNSNNILKKPKNNESSSDLVASSFNWDDYFEKNHKITTNQNFRFSSLTQNPASSNNFQTDLNMNDDQSSSALSSQLLVKKRFNYNLNSYKDRFHPYNSLQSKNTLRDDQLTLLFNSLSSNNTYNGCSSGLINTNHLNTSMTNSGTALSQTSQSIINIDQQVHPRKYITYDVLIDYDLLEIWKHGTCVIGYEPLCLKSACYICGSVGNTPNNTIYYCNVCCEPFHDYCLEDFEKPKQSSNLLKWVCPACKFCEICKLQNRLLYCHECENCYHASCFPKKSNYPKKSSKKLQIWVCFDCFKCTKCQSKDIGYDKLYYSKLYDYDFSVCFKCHEIQSLNGHQMIDDSSSAVRVETQEEKLDELKPINLLNEEAEVKHAEDVNINEVKTIESKQPLVSANIEDLALFNKSLTQQEAKMLAQKKKNFLINDLVKCPHEDHIYAISSQSIALALQSSNIFNQNNSISIDFKSNENIFKFLQEFKENNHELLTSSNQSNSPSFILKQFNNIKPDCVDTRFCLLCQLKGDDEVCGRLLPIESCWMHVNCLLWSNDVYINSHLVEHIHTCLQTNGKTKQFNQMCTCCGKEGASIKCNDKQCDLYFHFKCGYENKAYITLNKAKEQTRYQLYCPSHHKLDNVANELFNIGASLIINLNNDAYRKKNPYLSFNSNLKPHFLIGSLQVNNLGDIDTQSDFKDFICPINYACTRLYWSTKELGKKVLYKCQIKLLRDVQRMSENLNEESFVAKKDTQLNEKIQNETLLAMISELFDKQQNGIVLNKEKVVKKTISNHFNDVLSNQELYIKKESAVSEHHDKEMDELDMETVYFEENFDQELLCQLDGQNDSPSEPIRNHTFHTGNLVNELNKPKSIIKIEKPTNIAMNSFMPKIIIRNPTVLSTTSIEQQYSKVTTPTHLPSSFIAKNNTNIQEANTSTQPKILKINSNLITPNSNNTTKNVISVIKSFNQTTSSIKHIEQKAANSFLKQNIPVIKQSYNDLPSLLVSSANFDSNPIRSALLSSPFDLSQTDSSKFNLSMSIDNVSIISPKSDKSDSSLNLKNVSSLVNPLQSSFEDFLSHVPNQNANKSKPVTCEKIKQPKVNKKLESALEKLEKLEKKEALKKLKRPRENSSSKPTVAALLSASYCQKVVTPQPQPQMNQQTPNEAISNPIPLPLVSVPIVTKEESLLVTAAITEPIIKKEDYLSLSVEKKKKAAAATIRDTSLKTTNKLRDYFNLNNMPNVLTQSPQKDPPDSQQQNHHQQQQENIPADVTSNIENKKMKKLDKQKFKPLTAKKLSKKKLIRQLNNLQSMENQENQEAINKEEIQNEIKLLQEQLGGAPLAKKPKKEKAQKIKILSELNFKKRDLTSTTPTTASAPVKKKSSKYISKNEYIDVDFENGDKNMLVFEITSEDGFHVVSKDINKAWKVILERVNLLRQQFKQKALSFQGINGVTMYGLNNKSIVYMLEQFDSIEMCSFYKNKYIPRFNSNDKWVINVDGSARTAKPHDGKKKLLDPFHWLSSQYRPFNYINLNKVFNQQFLVSVKALNSSDMCNPMKYRHLKEFSNNGLIVKCSSIHGRGLFTLVDIHQSQMIIEYSGEIIRNQLCDKREKFYESKGIGCYMFRIDEFEVIDATTKGNQARFINHSCDPNCISKVMVIQGQKHIVIFAQRFIQRGEELTYDYKFPKEDVKIQCLCKSSKCRKYLN